MSNNTNIGIMAGAYFVSRSDLLSWLNTTLEINYQKVEQVSNGAAFCQILDAIFYTPHPAAPKGAATNIPLGKVKYNARTHDEIMTNYKILQSSFTRLGIKKVVDIQRLRQGRFQDNLEFLQWLKRYYDIKAPKDSAYSARERRRATGCAEPTFQNGGFPGAAAATAGHSKRGSTRSSVMPSPAESMNPRVASTPLPMQVEGDEMYEDEVMGDEMMMTTTTTAGANEGYAEGGADEMSIREMYVEATNLGEIVSTFESEKDFYYDRLFEIEMLCREVSEDPVNHKGYDTKTLAEAIKEILYKGNN